MRAGLVAVPVNPAYTPAEVDHIRTDAGAGPHLDAGSARHLLADAPREVADPDRDRGGEQLAALMYTSGTSGRTKGAMLPARALLANLDQLASVEPPLITADDVLFAPLPLSHIFGLNAALGMALRVGAKALYCTHHEPTRGDDELEAAFAQALARWQTRLGGLRVVLAYEGLEVIL